ncbi:bifunctional DNA primase/polymerase-like protein [Streptomyces sp. Ag109_O5-1]|uniref:bifunctional DNA primase/polymerase n=1 Tax=Streptomyces sp. Ag109_O5-1 TaxID=1938851 RepID=UPI000F4F9615|nr:bifunctional DNA primase/polymerase [Streptomyces sp. Ag109_O5-1]RPE39690.1 bifunctional DNA primase/polymerase-like protein [Streptomyces sp. Ag109_O5-1]
MTHHAAALRTAQSLASRGWHVFPLSPGAKRPAVRAWEARATTECARITRCWGHGPYNIAIATGPARLVVVDLDIPKNAEDTPRAPWNESGITDGTDVLAALCERHGQPYPDDTYTVRTASGGTHLYFTAPQGAELRNSAGKLGWKVDTRAAGGYVVAAGSIVGGKPYQVVRDNPPALLPRWIADLLYPAPTPPPAPVTVPLVGGRRAAYLRSALNAELAKVTGSQPGERNTTLYRAAVALGQLVAGGALAEGDVTAWLSAAAVQVGQGEREARNTIVSGLRAGAKRPRTVAA